MFKLHNKISKTINILYDFRYPYFFLVVASKMYCWNDVTLYVFMKHAKYPNNTADVLRRHHWFPCEMESEDQVQKFHTDDVLLPWSWYCSDWLCREGNLLQRIKSAILIWVVSRHQYGISSFVPQTSFWREASGGVAKYRLFSQPSKVPLYRMCCLLRRPLGTWLAKF